MSDDTPGFLSRWSRRKLDARRAVPADQPAAAPAPLPLVDAPETPASGTVGAPPIPHAPISQTPASRPPGEPTPVAPKPAEPAVADTAPGHATRPGAPREEKPPPTLEDVAALTADSDFSLFVGKGVAPEVQNAAMKKLFSDPHYNIMDGLDIYIDDYSQQEVMPQSMLRKMVGARVLNLFTDDDEAKAVAEEERLAALAAPADGDPPASIAQASGAAPDANLDATPPPDTRLPDADRVPAAAAATDATDAPPDGRPALTVLESTDSLDSPVARDPLFVPIKPGSSSAG